jgi:hypothetical protein
MILKVTTIITSILIRYHNSPIQYLIKVITKYALHRATITQITSRSVCSSVSMIPSPRSPVKSTGHHSVPGSDSRLDELQSEVSYPWRLNPEQSDPS